jgi:hypothetical protein
MARHIYIGAETGTVANYTNGILTAGEIDIQKLSATGPTQLALGDTPATAPQIRIVQGGGAAGKNIVSPWFYGKDVIDWSGRSYTAAVIWDETTTIAGGNSNGTGEATIKIVDKTNGLEPFTMKSWTYSYVSGQSPTNIADGLKALIIADPYKNAIETIAGVSNATLRFTSYAIGATNGYGEVVKKSGNFEVVFEDVMLTNTVTFTYSNALNTSPSDGAGDGIFVSEMELNNQGSQFGYYNRIQQPIAPTSYGVAGTNYDLWHVAATKDGSSSSQIHGVDNVIDMTIANTAGSGVNALEVENKLNAYFAGLFPNVIL